MERRTGRFKTSDRCYIDVCFWKGRLEVEAVADNLLLKPRSRRRANLPPFAPKDRDVPVSPREREILEEYRVRGPQLVLQRLRKAMSEVLKCGLDRDDLVHLAAKARRLNINW